MHKLHTVSLEDKKWIEENSNFISLFKNVDNESNPILVLFKFK